LEHMAAVATLELCRLLSDEGRWTESATLLANDLLARVCGEVDDVESALSDLLGRNLAAA
jgi:hypothetical protein